MYISKRCGSRLAGHSGFTMVELVIFIVIVSVAIVGVLQVMNVTASHSADPQVRKQALSIAEALMEEVSLAHFTYCDAADPAADGATSVGDCSIVENVGAEPGNARPYDNVNDYVTQYGAPQAIAVADVNSIGVPGLSNYKATIEIKQESLNGVPPDASLRITVRVSAGGETIRLDGYRTRYAPGYVP
jgi:MSHA pilin protein MshD